MPAPTAHPGRQITATDKPIDQEAHALDGLTAEEIALIEAG